MQRAPQGVHDFLRAYYHHKSADWKDNRPYPLKSWSAGELAKLPTYYVMDLAKTMAETVAEEMPSSGSDRGQPWLPDSELAFYSAEYQRTGFQGGLQWYRCGTSGAFTAELRPGRARTIDVPSCFISGQQDWGTYQRPGVFEAMQTHGLHPHDRLPSGRRRRPLGAAGTARGSQPAAAAILNASRSIDARSCQSEPSLERNLPRNLRGTPALRLTGYVPESTLEELYGQEDRWTFGSGGDARNARLPPRPHRRRLRRTSCGRIPTPTCWSRSRTPQRCCRRSTNRRRQSADDNVQLAQFYHHHHHHHHHHGYYRRYGRAWSWCPASPSPPPSSPPSPPSQLLSPRLIERIRDGEQDPGVLFFRAFELIPGGPSPSRRGADGDRCRRTRCRWTTSIRSRPTAFGRLS